MASFFADKTIVSLHKLTKINTEVFIEPNKAIPHYQGKYRCKRLPIKILSTANLCSDENIDAKDCLYRYYQELIFVPVKSQVVYDFISITFVYL